MLGRSNGGVWLVATMTVCFSLSAHAAGESKSGDAALGEKKFYTCYGCHGTEDYKNAYPEYSVPRLRHQTAEYIVAALQEYKTGERQHATMHAQAVSLSDQDMADIAAYLQGPQAVKPASAGGHTPPVQVTTCVACHGDVGLGVDAPMTPKPPILAGQHADYLVQALGAYKNGRRKNAIMAGMAASLASERDVEVAASYFAHQPSPLATATTGSK